MATTYRIVLQEGATHTRGETTFVNGVPQITGDLAKAKRYKADSRFTVSVIEDPVPELDEPAEEAQPVKPAAPVAKSPAKAPVKAPMKAPAKNDDEAPI